jgi:CTP synthase (UTP-ammonia lyase)
MAENVTVGIVGDRAPKNPTHTATEEALEHAGASLGVPVAARWLPTASLEGRAAESLRGFDAVFLSPGSPYESMDGALDAIRVAREGGVPFIGTRGGSQHAVIEYARNVLGLEEAGHAEYDTDAPQPLVSALSCSPLGQTMRVRIEPGSKVHGFYGGPGADEEYRCNYELAPGSRRLLEDGGLRVSGATPTARPE